MRQALPQRFVRITIIAAVTAAAMMVLSACGGSGDTSDASRPSALPAFPTPPVPFGGPPVHELSSGCDEAVEKAARKEGELRQALFECESFVDFMNGMSRYPAALPSGADSGAWLIQTCFRTSDEEYARSAVCQSVTSRGGVNP